MEVWKMSFLFKQVIFRFHVSLRECTYIYIYIHIHVCMKQFEIFETFWRFEDSPIFTVATLLLAFQENMELHVQLPRWRGLKMLDHFLLWPNCCWWQYYSMDLKSTLYPLFNWCRISTISITIPPNLMAFTSQQRGYFYWNQAVWLIHLRFNKKLVVSTLFIKEIWNLWLPEAES